MYKFKTKIIKILNIQNLRSKITKNKLEVKKSKHKIDKKFIH